MKPTRSLLIKLSLVMIIGALMLFPSSHAEAFQIPSDKHTLTASPEEYYNEALAEKGKGDLPAASLALRRALVLDPTLAVAQQELQEVLSKMGLAMDFSWQQQIASHCAPEKITFVGTVIGWSATVALIIIFFLQILPATKEPKRWRLFFLVLFLSLVGHAISVLGVIVDPRLHARYEVILLPKIDTGVLAKLAADDAEQGVAGAQHRSAYGNTRAASTDATQLCAPAGELCKNSTKAALEHRLNRPATTPLRSTPADAASVLAQLPTGSCLILLSQHGAWSYVRTAAGQEGWIASGSLEMLVPAK